MNEEKIVSTAESDVVLRTEHLCIQFGGLRAVDDVNLEIRKGELYGLIGPNGAGKTTVFNLLTGVYKPTSGKIFLCGKEIGGKAPAEINRMGIARTFQNIRLFNSLTVLENVMVGLANQVPCNVAESIFRLPRHKKSEKEMRARALELLKVFQLEEYQDYLASNLPYGKQRKLEIARAMATNPQLLLLDEPAAGMNPSETQELMDDITFVRREFGITILLIEHDMRLVGGICENLTVLNFGTELAKGETAKVLADPAVVTAYLGE
ncbi:MAG: ABC transporter ATP-binding protein [Ruminococcaceae bacterium]|nr:ABC transporter ATP-binding protein [Oscillospiraceae bacterium]